MLRVRTFVGDHGGPVLLAAAALLVTGVIVFMLLVLMGLREQLHAQSVADAAQQQSTATTISNLSAGLSTTEQQLKSHGITPAAPPPAQLMAGPPGPAGATGPGPSDAQVQASVDTYLVEHPPAGTVPESSIVDAVDAYLVVNPPAPGATGPGPTQQQIASAVATYMSANPAPAGPPGAQGQVGPAGPQGVAGASGSPGAPGPDPAGWTWTDPAGITYNCVEDSQTPAPHYTCTQSTVPTPTPTPTPNPTGTAFTVVSDRREHLAAV